MMKQRLACWLGVWVATLSTAAAGEIGFLETFALSGDRERALEQLIPGTRDHYYYTCLHLQNQGRLDEVDRVLERWIGRYKRTGRVPEIEARQALLRYGTEPDKTLDYLREHFNLTFSHRRVVPGERPELPTHLNPDLLSRQKLTQAALSRHSGTTRGFEDRALRWLASQDLTSDQRRDLLSRLDHPDVPDLAQLVVADLRTRGSRGFGSHRIHSLLMQSQLDTCLRLEGSLLNNGNFVNVYLTRLRPGPDENWRQDADAREAYLRRLWDFVRRLNANHNSLKVHVLYHWLVHDRSRGQWNRERFMTYLRLPRQSGIVNPDYLRRDEHQRHAANLDANYQSQTALSIVRDDSELVASYLAHFFASADSYSDFVPYLRESFVKRVFAETKILAGVGDDERWYSMLTPSEYQALKERVDIDFAPTNKRIFSVDEQVGLDVDVKNIETLLVKVFEINTSNYYRTTQQPIDTTIDLDGLVANWEETHTYDEPPLRRVRRRFEFEQIEGRGLWVIEFIGNGKSSRAVVQRGQLRYLSRRSVAGHVFTVLDESRRRLEGATLWLGGRLYEARDDGTIVVPYSNQPGRRQVVLEHDGFASLDSFQHRGESYSLSAGFHVEREALVKHRRAQLAVRPSLTVSGTPASLGILEETSLVITSEDREGVQSRSEISPFALEDGVEAVHEFQVPVNLARLTVRLEAKVQVLSQGEKQTLSAERSFQLNGIDATDKIEDLHLADVADGYVLDVLGKSGEILPHRPVHLTIKHREFVDTVTVTLQSDPQGRIRLGALEGCEWVEARGPEGTQHRWPLRRDAARLPLALHGESGGAVTLPYVGESQRPQRDEFSLLELRGGGYLRDHFDALSFSRGFVRIANLPAGDYELLDRRTLTRIPIRLTEGQRQADLVLGGYRQLEVRNDDPLHIRDIDVDDAQLRIHLENAGPSSRVHVTVSRFVPPYTVGDSLSVHDVLRPDWARIPQPESLYVVGRDIGEEYRYILERRRAERYPGVLLDRPTLLLNPWALRSTETTRQDAKAGTDFDRREADAAAERPGAAPASSLGGGGGGAMTGFSNLDFLGDGAVTLYNLEPDANGVVTIDRGALGDAQQVHVIAADPRSSIYRQVSLPAREADYADLRLLAHLDPEKHFTEQKTVSFLKQDEELEVDDLASASLEIYDSLARVFGLYATLSDDDTLAEFAFLLAWPELDRQEKLDKYSEYACHELHFFLYRKDPEFFAEVVRPTLENKYHKTFLDHWLLGADLTPYTEPWAYEQLNVFERILLARRIEGERQATERHLRDLLELLPPDPELAARLFDTALASVALDTESASRRLRGAALGLQEKAKKNAMAKLQEQARARRATSAELEALDLSFGAPKAPAAAGESAAAEGKPAQDALHRNAAGRGGRQRGLQDEALAARFAADKELRKQVQQLFRQVEKTKEWAENNYYHLPITAQNADLVQVSPFWVDFAAHTGDTPFFSQHLARAHRNLTEILLALAVLDLPFEAGETRSEIEDGKLTLAATSPLVVFHKEIRQADLADAELPILVSQNFYRQGERYVQVDGERRDKYVRDEFLVHTVYGGHVVITNPTSSRQKLNVLLQVPQGAIPVLGAQYTRSFEVAIEPYRTWTHDFHFYFPGAGEFEHYPVHVARDEKTVAHAGAFDFHVVDTPSRLDRSSWNYVSQMGSEDEVIEFLQRENLYQISLEKIAWRMRDKPFFDRVVQLLRRRHAYDHTLWSYSILHDRTAAVRDYLEHSDAFVRLVGGPLDTPVLELDLVERKLYQHLEYWPLVNARAHKLGARHTILNNRLDDQYGDFLKRLTYVETFRADDWLATAYYLLLQDRVAEGLDAFEKIRPAEIHSKLQYDYLAAYAGFYKENLRQSRSLAERYTGYPVKRWQQRFAAMVSQLDEIEAGKDAQIVDEEDRQQKQTREAADEATFDLGVEAREIRLASRNIDRVQLNFYPMDVELLFSRNPFVEQRSGRFTFVRPELTLDVEVDESSESGVTVVPLPDRYHSSNVLIEARGAGKQETQAYYSNTFDVRMAQNYAQLQVARSEDGRPLPRTYVKVYARARNGQVRFYKDGYTDLRGRFDYGSLSTNELENVERFSILVLSDEHGAVVREAHPPQL